MTAKIAVKKLDEKTFSSIQNLAERMIDATPDGVNPGELFAALMFYAAMLAYGTKLPLEQASTVADIYLEQFTGVILQAQASKRSV